MFVVFIGTVTYVLGLIGDLLARLTGRKVTPPKGPKTIDMPQMELLFTTIPSIQGKNIIHHFGLISAEAVLKEEDKKGFLDKIIRKKGNGFVYNLGKARNQALLNLQESAKKIGANAVLSVKIDYKNIGGLKGATMVATVTGKQSF